MNLPIQRLLVFTRDTDFYSEQVLLKLQMLGMEVAVVVEPHKQAAVEQRAPELKLLNGPALRNRFDRAAIRDYSNLIKSFRPDLCLCYTSRAFAIALLARRGLGIQLPIVGTRGAIGGISALNPLDWLTYFDPRVDAVVGFSKAIELRLRHEATRFWRCHPGHFLTIHKGYDSLSALIPQRLKDSPSNTVSLMCVANDRPIKGMDLLLDALDQHVQSDNWHLDLVGRMSAATSHKVESSPRLKAKVTLHGFCTDVRARYQNADVYIQPTRSPGEGIGNAIAEAMAAGLACIVTRAGGAPELVGHDENGLCITPDDPAALGQAVDKLISHPELLQAMGIQGPLRLSQHFRLSHEVSGYLELFSELHRS